MQKDGLIALANNDGRRKTYEITVDGKAALLSEYRRLQAVLEDSRLLEEGIAND